MAVPLRFLQGALVILVFMQSRTFGPSGSQNKYEAYPIPLFSGALKLTHGKSSRMRPCVLETFVHKFSVNSFIHSGRSRKRVSPYGLIVSILCWFMRRAYAYCAPRTLTSC